MPTPGTSPFVFKVQTDEYRTLPIPGVNAKMGDCFVRVKELPVELQKFMTVNPRVPSRTQKGVLSGPVIKGILDTLRDYPEDMAIKNQGIYLLARGADFKKESGGIGYLTVELQDPNLHGIVNGGHTFAAIFDAIEQVDEGDISALDRAYVRLHVLQGIDKEKVPEIAEGLNRSKQVDDPSLDNLRGYFTMIKDVLKNKKGEYQIAYNQGAEGDVYITELIVYLEMFNLERFDSKKHPHNLFARTKSALQFFESDVKRKPSPIELIVTHLPELLVLADTIRFRTPAVSNQLGFQFGRMKEKEGSKSTVKLRKRVPLHFIGKNTEYRVPRGWLYPMLAAFRANVIWDLGRKKFEWEVPLEELLKEVIDDLVDVCVSEHRDNNLKPDLVGKRESSYRQCYDKVLLHLLQRRVHAS